MTTSYSTSSPDNNKYKTQCGNSPAACHPFLEIFIENYPELHTLVHDNFVTDGTSGKRAIGDDADDMESIKHPVAPVYPQELATSLRRRLATPGRASGTLSKFKELVYYLAPAIAHEVDKELATIILECFTGTDANAELRKHCGSTNGTPVLAVDNFNSESLPRCPIPRPVGAVSAINIDTADDFDTSPPPTLIATVAASEPAPPAVVDMTTVAPTARDFSPLFGDGSIQAVLNVIRADENPADIPTRPIFDVDTPAATACTPCAQHRRPATVSRMRRQLDSMHPLPTMPAVE